MMNTENGGDSSPDFYQEKRQRAKEIYDKTKSVYCPYLDAPVVFNADGWYHLRYKVNRRERLKQEQILKFTLLPLAIEVIRHSGTHQEYRRDNKPSGARQLVQPIEYLGFVAIAGRNKVKVRAVVRRIGDGKPIFWSVMPAMKLKMGEDSYDQMMRLAPDDIAIG